MTYTYRNNGNITDFWPDDDEDTIYCLSGSDTLQELIDMAQKKWPDTAMDKIQITAEKIHTHCLTYDLYDSGDHTDFVVITRLKE